LEEAAMSRRFPHASVALCAALALIASAIAPGRAQSPTREPEAFLRKYVHLSDSELAAMKRGEAVAELVDTTNKRELAVFGAVRLAVPKDYFVTRVRDILGYKKNVGVLQIGKFSDPPKPDDLAALTIDADDLKALKACKVENCDVRMPADEIERFRTEIDWSRPDASRRATALARQMLLRYVTAYLAGGDDALAEYHDRKRALSLAEEYRSLVAASPYLAEYVPEYQAYLEQYPAGHLEQVENVIYWSKEEFGLKPVISVTHMTIYTLTRGGVTNVLIGSKQLYASRYFDSSFALTVFVEEVGGGPQPSSYLMYLNRSRTDQLGGLMGGVKRSIVEGRMVRGLKKNLRQTKDRLEAEYRRRGRE
jgi:hypothetical protein